ncbi:MAG: HAD-IA family hydrolase [Phycisphaerales bacterium]
MPDPPPLTICFDLGGVIVRICRSFSEACAAAGIEHRRPDRFAAPELKAARANAHASYQTGAIDCHTYFRAVADHSDNLYTPDEIRAIHDAWILAEYPGATDLINQLNAIPTVRTACLSNTNHRHWSAMRGTLAEAAQASSAALRLIAAPHASHLLALAKPAPAIYQRFERELDATPDRIVFFDDLPENIDAARARGWHAHPIDHTADPTAQIRQALRAHGIQLPASPTPPDSRH